MQTFTKRKYEEFTVKEKGTGSITTTQSSGFGVPEWVPAQLVTGGTYTLELYRFNDIAGIIKDGEYLFHRSDEYFADRLAKYLEESNRRQLEHYEANKDDWLKRTYQLSPRYRDRLDRFINDPEKGEEFRTQGMGWGYELIICELAQMYEQYGFGDGSWESEPSPIKEFANKYGTSGNQHECAKAFAKNQDVAI